MKRTQLYEEHQRLGAKIVEFAGWEMPLYYSGIVREVETVRASVGVFDLSHMGELVVSGPEALDLVQFVTTNDARKLDVGRAQYTLLCDEDGGVVDDLIVSRLDAEEYMLVVNASNTDADFLWIQQHNRFHAECRNWSDDTGIVAIQGPASQELLQPHVPFDLGTLRKMSVKRDRVGDSDAWVSRTGYTGEDGFELLCAASDCPALWRLILEAGQSLAVRPVGLGARDVLRMEAGYPLYGHELTRETSPVDARLLWAVQLDKGDFLGRQAMLRALEEGPRQVLVGLEAEDRCIPRHAQEVYAEGVPAGWITSGTFSPTVGRGIAMAYVKPDCAEVGTRVQVDVRGKMCNCQIVNTPFHKSEKRVSAAIK